MAKAKKESKTEVKAPVLDLKEKTEVDNEIKDAEVKTPEIKEPVNEKKEPEVKPEVKDKESEAEVKPKEEARTPCENCSIKFDSASCKSCIIYKRLKK